MIEAILFDIGNVLLRFDFNLAAQALAAHSRLPAPEIRAVLDDLHTPHESGGISSDEFIVEAMKRMGCAAPKEVFLEAFTGIFTPNEPMWEFDRALRGKVRRVLFSNTSRIHQEHVFAFYPEFQTMDGGVYSWTAKCMKPDEGIYLQALALLNLPPERVAYIDDLLPNIETGRRLGLRCLHYHPDRHAEFLREAAALGLPPAAGSPA